MLFPGPARPANCYSYLTSQYMSSKNFSEISDAVWAVHSIFLESVEIIEHDIFTKCSQRFMRLSRTLSTYEPVRIVSRIIGTARCVRIVRGPSS